MDTRLITFLSDFGHDDVFVGLCHAVMAAIVPEVPKRRDVVSARYFFSPPPCSSSVTPPHATSSSKPHASKLAACCGRV